MIGQSNPGTKIKNGILNAIINKKMISEGRKSVHELDELSRNAKKTSEDFLLKLLDENKDTEYGRKYGFADIHSVEEFKDKVPFSDYDTYAPYIKRMIENDEDNLISAKKPVHYALSSGSIGVPKHIPVSEEELKKYKKFTTNLVFGVIDEFYRNTTGKPLDSRYGLSVIEVRFGETKFGIPKGAISGNILKQVKDFTPYFLSSPWEIIAPETDMDLKYLRARFALETRNITFLNGAFITALVDLTDYICNNWEMLCKDIYHGRINKDIDIPRDLREKYEEMLKPNPKRAKQLTIEFQKGTERILPRIWPGLRFVASIGTGGFATYAKRLKHYTGRNIPFINTAYAASEGIFAAGRRVSETSYVLIPDGGFYEFIPMKTEDETKTLTMEELEEGEEYEIIITNTSGFYRYRIKDVIRCTGFYNEAPMIEFIYRKNQMISIAGEKTNEEAVRWSVHQFEKQTGININDYSLYADTNTVPGHYAFVIEPEKLLSKEDYDYVRDVLESKLMQANPSFGDKIRTGVLGKSELIVVQNQTYQLYRELMMKKGVSSNQLKPVRVIDTPIKKDFFFTLREE